MSTVRKQLGGIDSTTFWIAVGSTIAVLGLVSVFTASLDFSQFGEDRFRLGLGVLAVAIGSALIRRWVDATDEGYRPPERERVLAVGVPGDELDDLLALRAVAGSTEAIQHYRSQIRDELMDLAIDVLTTYRGHTEDEARAALRSGEWTDDEAAASFFKLSSGTAASEELANTFRRPGPGDHPFTRRTRRAIEALIDIAEGDR